MKTYNYHDPKNQYPYAILNWEGEGYYAGYTSNNDTFVINLIAPPPITMAIGLIHQ